ncbi:MAG: hypothetical protein CMF17_09090 [Idiomarinaceae bacterium]|nr:hypothetical protein [Idiomarinaceae bacterium]
MNKDKDSKSKAKHPEERVFWIVGLGLLTIALVPSIFALVFHSLEWGGPTDWATFATYFSGVATPIVALCSALLFYRSLIVQRDEFEKTRSEMEAATRIQQKAEQSRIETSKQERLERTIPIARDNQIKILAAFMKKCDEVINETYEPVEGRVVSRDFSEESGGSLTESEIESITKPIKNYRSIGRHVMCMIKEYIEFGGDIYAQLNVIITIDNELASIYKKIEFINLPEFAELAKYRLEVEELDNLCQEEISNYVAKRTKEPQPA